MIENKKIINTLIILTIGAVIIGGIFIACFYDSSIIQDVISFFAGIIASLITSIVISGITYKYIKEETEEKLIKNLIEIYFKMIKFKCTFNSSKTKNEMIVKLQGEIDEYLSIIHDIEYDFVYKLKMIDLKETITLYKYNDKAISELVNNIEFKDEKMIIKAKGLNTQKDFIASYNNMLNKVREYLEIFMVEKYEKTYKLFKRLDYKYEDVYTDSNEIIEYDLINKD